MRIHHPLPGIALRPWWAETRGQLVQCLLQSFPLPWICAGLGHFPDLKGLSSWLPRRCVVTRLDPSALSASCLGAH